MTNAATPKKVKISKSWDSGTKHIMGNSINDLACPTFCPTLSVRGTKDRSKKRAERQLED